MRSHRETRALGGGKGGIRELGNTDRTTDFGFRTVPRDEKSGLVHGVFSSVASRYDVMNDAMSFGIHRLWKDAMIDWLAPKPGQELLDIAGGTGDVAIRFLSRVGDTRATVLDLTESMLDIGRQRATRLSLDDRIAWVNGDATRLPFDSNRFDACTMAFGIRNIDAKEDAIREAYRVLRFGGRLLVLEFGQVPVPMLRKIYDHYSFRVIPWLGSMIANDRASYEYLVESIRRFPDQASFVEMLGGCGFERVAFRNLTMGVVAIHSGWKI